MKFRAERYKKRITCDIEDGLYVLGEVSRLRQLLSICWTTPSNTAYLIRKSSLRPKSLEKTFFYIQESKRSIGK